MVGSFIFTFMKILIGLDTFVLGNHNIEGPCKRKLDRHFGL